MLFLYKDYEFSQKDIGKIVVLQNSKNAKIVSVIREYGGVSVVFGKSEDKFYIWNSYGQADTFEESISIVMEKSE